MKKYVAEMIGTIIGSSILFILAKDSGSTTTLTGVNGYHDLVPAFVAEKQSLHSSSYWWF